MYRHLGLLLARREALSHSQHSLGYTLDRIPPGGYIFEQWYPQGV
jgi:hypothetical protein